MEKLPGAQVVTVHAADVITGADFGNQGLTGDYNHDGFVDLFVSKGRQPLTVADWTGKDAGEATTALERKGDIASFLTALEPRSIFFVDELHRLPRALEETFYPAMEDRQLPITVGQGAGADRKSVV